MNNEGIKVLWVSNIDDIYILGKEVGQGQYGSVRKAYCKILGLVNPKCVCKLVQRKDDYVRELDHLIALRKCYGILPIRRAVFSKDNLAIEFDEAESNLAKYIRANMHTPLKTRLYEALSITNQLLISLAHIHENHIVHRDLKSGNVVITHDDSGVRAWIIDFGMSKRIVECENSKDISCYEIVTSTYRAPELWKTEASMISGREYNSKIDVWSVGCILYELVTGDSPFNGNTTDDVRKKISAHCLHVTGTNDKSIYPGNVKPLNLEKRIEDFINNNVDLSNSMVSLNLSSMEDTTPPESEGSQIGVMFYIIRNLLRTLLDPNPDKRPTALVALEAFSAMHMHHSVLSTPVNTIPNFEFDMNDRGAALTIINTMYEACTKASFNPNVAYLGLYLWLRCIMPKEISKAFKLNIILMACLQLASSYCGSHVKSLCIIRGHIVDGKEDPSELEEECVSNVLMLMSGRLWAKNPGDIRHIHIKGCRNGVWNRMVDEAIFTAIITDLSTSKEFLPPCPHKILEEARTLAIYQLAMSPKSITARRTRNIPVKSLLPFKLSLN